MAVQSFSDRATEEFFKFGEIPTHVGWQGIAKIARRKLDMLHSADKLSDLFVPPKNRLEALRGDWKGFYSIRINDQWRIVFRWATIGPSEVKIVDYHE